MGRRVQARVVLVASGNLGEARKIAEAVVEKRLAACVNVNSWPVESIYRWKGEMQKAEEFLLVIKTTTRRLKELEKEVLRLHSYEVPEFLVIKIEGGSAAYLKWLGENC